MDKTRIAAVVATYLNKGMHHHANRTAAPCNVPQRTREHDHVWLVPCVVHEHVPSLLKQAHISTHEAEVGGGMALQALKGKRLHA